MLKLYHACHKLTNWYIRLPYMVGEQGNNNVQFAAMSSFPNVIGAIDCTHIGIRAFCQNEAASIN